MGCEIAIGYTELFLQAAEIIVRIGDQHRHDLQADTMFQHFIQVLEGAFHLIVFVVHDSSVYNVEYAEA